MRVCGSSGGHFAEEGCGKHSDVVLGCHVGLLTHLEACETEFEIFIQGKLDSNMAEAEQSRCQA